MTNKILVILGATSSLAQNKILPYLNNIDAETILYTRRPIKTKYNSVVGDLDDFNSLLKFINSRKINNIYFYFALPPNLFRQTIISLQKYFPGKNIHFALEKPFGTSLMEAAKLAAIIEETGEDKFYLVDHYLAKEALTTFLKLPARLRKKVVNLKNIKSIQVSLLEKEDVAGRATFYDKIGAIKDTGQNHLLNILSAFISPDNRLETLRNLIYVQNSLVTKQYRGYKKTEGVDPNSITETYFRAKFNYGHIEVTLETGKALPETKTFIKVLYQNGRRFELKIKPYPGETKTAHEHIIDDFLKEKKRYSLKIDEALESWRVIDQVNSVSCQIYCIIDYKNPVFAFTQLPSIV
jgi:glucose-6-phosphate 1-dehydrogenase